MRSMNKPALSHGSLGPPSHPKTSNTYFRHSGSLVAEALGRRPVDTRSAFCGLSDNVVAALSTLPTSSRRFDAADARSTLGRRCRLAAGALPAPRCIRRLRLRRRGDWQPTLGKLTHNEVQRNVEIPRRRMLGIPGPHEGWVSGKQAVV